MSRTVYTTGFIAILEEKAEEPEELNEKFYNNNSPLDCNYEGTLIIMSDDGEEDYGLNIGVLRENDKEAFLETIYHMGYLSQKKKSDIDLFWEYAEIIGAAFVDEDFNWGENNISDKVFEYIPQLLKSLAIGNPPAEAIFLDKKLGGVFFILQQLKSKFNLNKLLDEVLLMKEK